MACDGYLSEYKYRVNYYFEKYAKFMSDQLNFYELISLTISERQLFDCNSNVISSDNCIDSIDKNIVANNVFGICFQLFGNNRSIYLNNKDFVEIVIDNEKRANILKIHTTTDKTQLVIFLIIFYDSKRSI